MISLSIFFFICFRTQSSATFSDFTLNGRFLPNKNFESLSASDWMQCLKTCHAKANCLSYNYEAAKAKSCYLNECGFRDRCEALRNLVVSSGAIFHQLKQPMNETLCSLPIFKEGHPSSIDNSSEEGTYPVTVIEPARCPYDKNVSHEDPLYNVTVCGRRRYFLHACSNKNPIQLISVRYVQCTCACEACETMHVPNACVPRDVLNKISEECEGKAWCRVRRPHVSCHFGYKTAIRITYSCHTRKINYEEGEEENGRRGGRRQRHRS